MAATFSLYEAFFTPTPALKKKLRMAHMNVEPKKFLKQTFTLSLYISIALTVVIFFLTSRPVPSPIAIILFPFLFFGSYTMMMGAPDVYIRRREREITQNIVYATRYLILKIDSGQPLLNSMISASQSYGVGAKFFQEIVDEVNLGKPIEDALEDAHHYSPSKTFQLVLRQILNALRTGIDVSGSLKKILDEIVRQQQIEIKEYGKKLNSLVLFYMIMACVIPSLGISMFLVIGSMVNLNLDFRIYAVIFFLLFIMQLFFIGLIRSIKPMVEI